MPDRSSRVSAVRRATLRSPISVLEAVQIRFRHFNVARPSRLRSRRARQQTHTSQSRCRNCNLGNAVGSALSATEESSSICVSIRQRRAY